jgi:hypothetical protein
MQISRQGLRNSSETQLSEADHDGTNMYAHE